MRLADIEAAIRGDDVHFPRTRLICLENTHNRCNGSSLTPHYMDSVAALARRHGLSVHLDGARIFNAAVALGVDVKELTRSCDSLIFCLSKGLSAPVGSLVCGSRQFVAEARRACKMLGGSMRQTGIIAAAGIVALEQMADRVAEDHANARRLAEGIARIPGLSIDAAAVQTNILYFNLVGGRLAADEFVTGLGDRGVKFLRMGPSRFRMVTHNGIGPQDIAAVLAALSEVMATS